MDWLRWIERNHLIHPLTSAMKITKKQLVMRNRIMMGVIGFFGVVALVSGVMAFSGSAQNVVENCEGCSFNTQSDSALGASEELLGASGARFPNGISADSTSPAAGEVRGTTVTVTGESQFSTVVQGGSYLSTSTPGNTTLTAAQVCDNSVIEMTPTIASVNVTFPATSTLFADCLDTVGDSKDLLLTNATGTAGILLTLVADESFIGLGTPTSTAATSEFVAADEWARVRMTRIGNSAGDGTMEITVFGEIDP